MDAADWGLEWGLVGLGRLTPERMRRLRAEGVHVHVDRDPDFLGGEPTGMCTLMWSGPRPAVLDPGLFERGYPRSVSGY